MTHVGFRAHVNIASRIVSYCIRVEILNYYLMLSCTWDYVGLCASDYGLVLNTGAVYILLLLLLLLLRIYELAKQ